MKNTLLKTIISVMLMFVLLLCGCTIHKYDSLGNFNIKDCQNLCKEKKYKEALQNVDDFLKKYPNNKIAIEEKAYILIKSDKNDEGLALLTDLYNNGEHSSTILNNICWAYNNLHLYEMANNYIDISLKNFTPTETEYVNKGNALHGLKNYDEAITYYDKALDKNPKSTLGLWGKGLCLYDNMEYIKCLECFKSYEALGGDNKDLDYYFKNSYLKLKDFDGAIDELNILINKDTNNYSASISLGIVYEEKGDYDKALACYDSIIKKAPDNAAAYYNKSICLVKMGKYDEACDSLKLTVIYDNEYLYDILKEPEFKVLKNNLKFKDLFFKNDIA